MNTDNPRQKLLSAAQAFCSAFANQTPPEEIYAHFSAADNVLALEHGLPTLAPFLGRAFTGQSGIREYFETISSVLEYENMRFDRFIVDPDVREVSCRGHARFTWKSTGQAWDEEFAYMLGFDEFLKVQRYEIWADTGAAYLASKGQLT